MFHWGVGAQTSVCDNVISTYELSSRISLAESSSPGAFVSSCFLIRKNRTVPTRLITVRAMKTVLRSLSVEKQIRVITRCAKATWTNSTTFQELKQTYYGRMFKMHTNFLTYLSCGAKGTQLLANSCLTLTMPIKYWHINECHSHFLPCKGYDQGWAN